MQTKQVIDLLSGHMEMNPSERESLEVLLSSVCNWLERQELRASDERLMIMASHLLAFVRRVDAMEFLEEKDTSLFEELDKELVEGSRAVLEAYCSGRNYSISDTEACLLAIHFAVCELG